MTNEPEPVGTEPVETQSEAAADSAAGPQRPPTPRSAVVAALAVAVGAVVVLLSSSPQWVHVTLKLARGQVKLTGSSAAAAAVPLALVAAAGLIAMALVRPWVRRILAVLITAAGVGVVIVVIGVLADPTGVARRSNKVKTAGELASAHLTAAPFLALIGGLLVVFGGLTAALLGGRWPGPTPRYERIAARAGRPLDPWEALESGQDPTDTTRA